MCLVFGAVGAPAFDAPTLRLMMSQVMTDPPTPSGIILWRAVSVWAPPDPPLPLKLRGPGRHEPTPAYQHNPKSRYRWTVNAVLVTALVRFGSVRGKGQWSERVSGNVPLGSFSIIPEQLLVRNAV